MKTQQVRRSDPSFSEIALPSSIRGGDCAALVFGPARWGCSIGSRQVWVHSSSRFSIRSGIPQKSQGPLSAGIGSQKQQRASHDDRAAGGTSASAKIRLCRRRGSRRMAPRWHLAEEWSSPFGQCAPSAGQGTYPFALPLREKREKRKKRTISWIRPKVCTRRYTFSRLLRFLRIPELRRSPPRPFCFCAGEALAQ